MYEWDVPLGREQAFIDEWSKATLSIRRHCGSVGSRLHQSEDGTWVAYARWPSLEAHDRCTPEVVTQLEVLDESIAGPARVAHRLRIVQDFLAEPDEG